MRSSLIVFFVTLAAGAIIALNLRQPGASAAGCTCSASITCNQDFESIANDGQAQNCCLWPTNFPTDILKFKVTRKENRPCRKDHVWPMDTSGSTCEIDSQLQPQPDVGVYTCWDSEIPRHHTVSFNIQRLSDAADGGLRVGVFETADPYADCATLWGYFDSSVQTGTPLCSNCTNPGPNCNYGMCSNC